MTDENVLKSQIGARLKALREEQGHSLVDMANHTGIETDKILSYEQNKILPSIGELAQIANVLNTPIGHFFQTQIPDKRVELVKADNRWNIANGDKLFDPHHYKYQALSYRLTDKLMAPFYVEIPPGKTEANVSSHNGEEFLYVLSGHLIANIDGKDYELQKGDSVYFDSRLKHSLKAEGAESVLMLAVVANAQKEQPENTIQRVFDKR